MKKEKGITLIALVITIIVLLILSGVTLVALTGDNGILRNAEKAKEETEIANEKEMIQLAISSYLIGEKTEEELKKQLRNSGFEVTGENFKNVSNGYIFKGTKNQNYMITPKGEITAQEKWQLFYEELEIGKEVIYTGYEDTYSGKWILYYADNKNVYLIMKDAFNVYLKDKKTSVDGELTYSGISDIYNSKYKDRFPIIQANWLKYITKPGITKATYSFFAIEYLLDSNNWQKFKNQYAEYAVGCATAELVEQSVKRERKQKGEDIPILTVNVDETLNHPGYTISLSGDIPINSASYSVHSMACYYGGDYWEQRWWSIGSGKLGHSYYSNTRGIKPVVCLKSDVVFKENDEGKYEISFKK